MKKILLAGCVVVVFGVVVLLALNGKQDAPSKSGADGNEGLTTQGTRPSPEITSGNQRNDIDLATKNEEKHENEFSFSEEVLSEPVRDLLGLDGVGRNYNSLGDAVGKLSKDLSSDDVAALRDFLTWSNDRFPEGMREIEINAIKNDVLDRLLRQNTLPEGIGTQIVEMYRDTTADSVWRDYCVQFMTPCYERLTTEYAEHTEGLKSNQSVDELNLILEALIGLGTLSKTYDAFDREAVVSKSSEIALDESVSSMSRTTALRLSAGMSNSEQGISNDEVAEIARLVAQSGDTVLLRSAAIVTLGEMGSEADRELFESYVLSDDRQIAGAAGLALQKMDARVDF